MRNQSLLIGLVVSIISYVNTMAQSKVTRKDLLHALMEKQTVSNVEIKEVYIPVGQSSPRHTHPCPVVGYVASGRILFQIDGEQEKIIQKGEAFYEPKNKVIVHFDNASSSEPLIFIAFYLKESDEANVELVK